MTDKKLISIMIGIIILLIIIQYVRFRTCISNIKRNYDTIVNTGIFPCGTESSGQDEKTNIHFGVYVESGKFAPFPLFSSVVIWKNDEGKIIED